MRFENRSRAGERLAIAVRDALGDDAGDDALVLALPRGGVPVAAPVARALHAPLDVLLVRKLGAPGNPELALGAIAEGGVRVLNDDLVRRLGVDDATLARETERRTEELRRRARRYRGDAPPADAAGRTAVVVDDGIATGATVRAAVRAARTARPRRLVVATPVAAPDAVRALESEADLVVPLHAPEGFGAVAAWYVDFPQTEDDEVVRLLAEARERRAGSDDG